MTLLERIRGRARPAPRREPRFEHRDSGSSLARIFGDAYSDYGGAVPPERAQRVAAVSACVGLVSNCIGGLPATLTLADDTTPAPPTSPAWAIIARPNPRMGWCGFVSFLVAQLLLGGNGVAWIETDGRGAVSRLTPLPWSWLVPRIVDGGDGARLVLDVTQHSPETELIGLPRRLLDTDVLWLRARGDHGIVGRSVLSRAAAPVSEGIEIAKLAGANWRNGARPSGVLAAPNYLSKDQRDRYETELRPKFIGSLNAGNVPLLEGGWKYEQIAMSSVDSQFLQSREFSVSDIARLFAVPEPLLQIGNRSISDLTPFVTAFAQLCLSPIVTQIEAEFDHAVLPSSMHLSIDLDGLMRGSFSAVVAALAALKQSAIITSNDARGELGWPPIEGGDALQMGRPPNWPADGPGSTHLGPSPGPTGNGPAEPGNNTNDGVG